tara:strand:+ start:265 stop:582 length:318 start_codon:yes stop_codon:yes gene_type:complete
MFGKNNMQEMMAKLQDMKGAVDNSKKRLENVHVKGESQCKRIRYVLDGNRKIKDLKIDDQLLKSDKEELIDLLIVAFNKAIDDADHVNENELKSTAQDMFPDLGK